MTRADMSITKTNVLITRVRIVNVLRAFIILLPFSS
jgi:hypothetical protein